MQGCSTLRQKTCFDIFVINASAGCGEVGKGTPAPATEGGAKSVATIHALEQAVEANDVNPTARSSPTTSRSTCPGDQTCAVVRPSRPTSSGYTRSSTRFGANEGALDGVAPTHRPVGWLGADVDRFAPDGRIKERRVYFDGATAVAQAKGAGRPIPEESALVVIDGTRTGDTNATILDRMDRSWEGHEEAKWSALLADEVECEDLAAPKPVRGRALLKVQWFSAAVRDATPSSITTWTVGSFVIDEASLSGLQKRQLVALYELRIAEVNDGQTTRGWTYANGLDLQTQLGANK